MRIYNSLSELPKLTNLVLTQGTFDGVHHGHRKVLNKVISLSKEMKGTSMLLTFYPHPRLILNPTENGLKLITTLEEKAIILQKLGIEHLLVLPFTEEFSKMGSTDFVKKILVDALQIKAMIIGHDHKFGNKREGDFNLLKSLSALYNFSLHEIAPQELKEITVSSTKVRNGLLNGDIAIVNEQLVDPFSFTGRVVHGKKLGRTLGFPTANVQLLDPYKIIPRKGVYAIFCYVGIKKYSGVMNIGNNPTIENKGFSIEAHLFNFNENLYDSVLRIELIAYLRDEKKFNSLDALKQQIHEDSTNAKQFV